MRHRPIGRQPGGDVAANRAVDHPVADRYQPQRSGHRFEPRRVNPGGVHQNVNGSVEDHDQQESCEHGADPSQDFSRGGRW